LLPGSTLGVVGGGQLGRMFAIAARRLGYGVVVLDPTRDCPAAAVADAQLVADFDDDRAMTELARRCDRVTFEFENAPADVLGRLAQQVDVHPAPRVLEACRQRALEKRTLTAQGFPVAPYRDIRGPEDIGGALEQLGPSILKRAEFGYDGKGQARLAPGDDAAAAWAAIGSPVSTTDLAPAVLERMLAFERELSVIVARGLDGATVEYPVFENHHEAGILDLTRVPARIDAALAAEARDLGRRVAEALDVVGLLTVELFHTGDGLIVNELAPRPHNSGHVTIEACATCQFENHVRALCGLPLGDTSVVAPGAMANLLGDHWSRGTPDFAAALEVERVRLHLYGKRQARPGRKMGHLTAVAADADRAAELVAEARRRL
jgi:5-(carboxyamino)imidazole ribonucleotide synthase